MKLNFVSLTGIIALLWIATYTLNKILFSFTAISFYISLIFIPTGFKVACVTIYRWRAILGILIGSVITGLLFVKELVWGDILMFALFSACLPFLALKIMESITQLKPSLENISVKFILGLSVVYAFLNSLFHVSYQNNRFCLRHPEDLPHFFSMAIGDILGTLLFMVLIAKCLKAYSRYQKTKNRFV